MKFLQALVVISSLALSVVATPIQQEERGLANSGSCQLVTRFFEEGEILDRDDDYESELERRADAASLPKPVSDYAKLKTDLQGIVAKSLQVETAFQGLTTNSNPWQVFSSMQSGFDYIRSIFIIAKAAKKLKPATSKAEAQSVLEITYGVAQGAESLLQGVLSQASVFKSCGCIPIIIIILEELLFIILFLLDLLICLLQICGPLVGVVKGLQDGLKTNFANTMTTLAKA